jgi:DNA polymerase III subunit gamma/tau
MNLMSTVVLARKYRPRNFAQMAGQEHVVRALGNALRQQRLHHAYLFTGTRGIGKTTVSRILAKSLNCTGADGQGGITAEPCGVCTACREIDNDRFIDYIEMDAASNRGIDEVRDMIERAAYKPSVGRFKVFMIDEAHQLTKEAFNALLKTLEEPPDYLKFVLATTDPDKMLPTVLSRCLQFNLRPMAPETVRTHLQSVLKAEGILHDDGALQLLSKAARGSMRDALSLTDQAIAYGGGTFDEALVRVMLGLADGDTAPQLIRALTQRDGAAMLATVQQMSERGLSFSGVLEQMALLLQQMAVAQAVPGALRAEEPETVVVQELAVLMTPEETQLAYSLCLHGRDELALMSDTAAAFSMVLLRYLAFPPVPSSAGTAPRTAALRAPSPAVMRVPLPPSVTASADLPAAVLAPASTPVAPAPRARPPVNVAQATVRRAVAEDEADANPPADEDPALSEQWNQLVRALVDAGHISGLVRELAWQSAWVRASHASPPVWTLRNEHEALRAAGLRDKLAAALVQFTGQGLVLDLEAGRPLRSPARREAEQRERLQREAEQQIQQDPVVTELLKQFKTARLVPGSIKPVELQRARGAGKPGNPPSLETPEGNES